jgi:hypothetical protein
MKLKYFIHNTPSRKISVKSTIQSLKNSDIPDFEVLCHDKGLSKKEIKLWFLDTLKNLSKDCDFLVRFEDDTIVNKHIHHNLQKWRALHAPDFGIGQLFFYDANVAVRDNMLVANHGAWCRKDSMYEGSQGNIFKSKHIQKLADNFFEAEKFKPNASGLGFDWKVTRALNICGLRTYVHFPSLVNCNSSSKIGGDGTKHEGHFSHKTFNIDWKHE